MNAAQESDLLAWFRAKHAMHLYCTVTVVGESANNLRYFLRLPGLAGSSQKSSIEIERTSKKIL